MDTAQMQVRLEAERAKLVEELRGHGILDPETHEWQGAAEGDAEDSADENIVADAMEELVTNVAVVEELQKRLTEVKGALARIDAGTYGVCTVCGKPIPEERLMANPAAQTCIEHA